MFVLGLNSGYTVKHNPFPPGVRTWPLGTPLGKDNI